MQRIQKNLKAFSNTNDFVSQLAHTNKDFRLEDKY